MGKIVHTNKLKEFARKNTQVFDSSLGTMALDILQVAKIRVPFKEGDLFKDSETRKIETLWHRVIFNKEYAAYQERGRRKDGTRVVRNYTTPGTGKDYLKDAGKTISEKVLDYLKLAASQVKV